MRTLRYFLLATLTITMVGLGMFQAREADEPKFTIKQVMKMAHKDRLVNKVIDGKGSKEDKEKLLELYTALSENKPPKNDDQDWKDRTAALVKAAKEEVDGDKNAGKDLKKAANCNGCHMNHKGN